MSALICKRWASRVMISVNSNTHLRFFQFYALKTSSTAKKDELAHSFRVNYLVNSCFLSLESAKSVAEKLRFLTPERPDAVLDLFKSHGFTNEQISRVIRLRPKVLQYDAKKTLSPKLEFFRSKQVSSSDVAMTVAGVPTFLCSSLENYIVPCYDFLKSILVKDQRVFTLLKRSRSRLSLFNLEKILGPNVSLMRKIGLPESSISLLLYRSPNLLSQKPDKLDKLITKVLNLGFNPSQAPFVDALEMINQLKESTWERKMEVYRSWGWSDDEIWAAFRKSPRLMSYSDNKISNAMDFFLKKMGWKTSAIAKSPSVFHYSLEKRIIPRCLLVKILLQKGLVGEADFYIPTILALGRKQFLDKFVIKHQEQIPLLMTIFLGEVDLQELCSKHEEMFQISGAGSPLTD
ncbi:transcription termination factor MTERF2, chloroplastic-like [Tripterygium wilfordii]|uniref:transcription termination factor MTERF2, chloroplastic-like n=1 Tax=Tripterygium wilfordii TaxID=458696 RepID=UPI0018F824D3|nr:transcription termination factor MTERF2, chloroplastic-like [Tripterygium wilfordii]